MFCRKFDWLFDLVAVKIIEWKLHKELLFQ